MEVTTQTVAPREVEFTIHPDPEQVDEARREAARKAARRVRIPGYRPGKAPYPIVERTVGREYLTDEAAEILAPRLYQQALEAGGYEPYDRPTVTVVQQEPLELKIRVPLRPTVKLPDYRAMKVEPEAPVQVTPEQEERVLNELRQQHGTWVPVERPAQMGDQVTLDLRGTVEGEVVSDEEGAEIVLAESLSPPGFAEEIAGMEAGQTRQFDLAYPQEYPGKRLAGQTVKFTATLHAVKERRLPELDDEFATSVGGYATLEELKARLREGLQAQLEADARDRLATQVLDRVMQQSSLEYPNVVVEREIDGLIRQREGQLRRQGFTLESYLRTVHKSMPQLRDEVRPEAEETVRRALVLRQVAQEEEIELQVEDVLAEVNRLAQAYGEQAEAAREALAQEPVLASISNEVYLRQALERLVDVVTGKAEEAAPSEAEAAEAGAPPEAEAEAEEAAETESETPGAEAPEETPGA